MAGLLLVHGAWHGPWCWIPLAKELEARGVTPAVVELGLQSLDADTLVTTQAIEELARESGGDVVVCGHSYGGTVVTGAAAGQPEVRHLVYLCAFVPSAEETTESMADEGPHARLRDVVRPQPDGVLTLDPATARDVLYHDCTEEQAAWAVERLRPQQRATFQAHPTGEAWQQSPSTYVLCTEDRAVHPELQRRMSARATTVVELAAGHSPFLSQPAALADLLASIVTS